jgi:hypothetical protein
MTKLIHTEPKTARQFLENYVGHKIAAVVKYAREGFKAGVGVNEQTNSKRKDMCNCAYAKGIERTTGAKGAAVYGSRCLIYTKTPSGLGRLTLYKLRASAVKAIERYDAGGKITEHTIDLMPFSTRAERNARREGRGTGTPRGPLATPAAKPSFLTLRPRVDADLAKPRRAKPARTKK